MKKACHLFLSLIVALSLFGCDAPPSEEEKAAPKPAPRAAKPKAAQELHAKGLKLYKEERYGDAIEAWLEEAELDPGDANILNNIGIAYRSLKDKKKAIEYHKKAIELNPNFGKAYQSLGLAYHKIRGARERTKAFSKAAELNYDPAYSYFYLALAHFDLQEYEEAALAYEKAIGHGMNTHRVYYNLGHTYMEIKDFNKAADTFKKHIALGSPYTGAHMYLGESYASAGMSEAAMAEFEVEAELNPGIGHKVELAILKTEAMRNPTAGAFFKVGKHIKEHMIRYREEAKEALREALRLDPSYPGAHLLIGKIHEENIPGNTKSFYLAKDEYEKELVVNPGSEEAMKGFKRLKAEIEDDVDTTSLLTDQHSAFSGLKFPQKGIVGTEGASTYYISLIPKGTLSAGSELSIAYIYDRRLKRDYRDYNYYYVLDDKKTLVNARDVIPLSVYENPAYISPKEKIEVIKVPVSANLQPTEDEWSTPRYYLWLKTDDKKMVLLDKHLYGDLPVSWSPDERYLFVDRTGTVFSSDGSREWHLKNPGPPPSSGLSPLAFYTDDYTSPVWHNGSLYLRGIGPDDRVYSFNPETGKFKIFLEVDYGKVADLNSCGIMAWDSIEVEGGTIKARFYREDPSPPDKDKDILLLDLIADESGNIVEEIKNWRAQSDFQ
ncbi:MAG: tetratricopeptide repeat protein [Thermodesulfobacteriota bacterium]